MEIITSQGIAIRYFDQRVASVIGNIPGSEGVGLLSQATSLGRKRIEICDWLFCLAKTSGTEVRKHLIDQHGQRVEDFVRSIHGGLEFSVESKQATPTKVIVSAVSEDVVKMLNLAGTLAAKKTGAIDELMLTLALLQTADESLRTALELWVGDAQALSNIERQLEAKIGGATIVDAFKTDGVLETSYLSANGRRFIQRLGEDAASIRARKITTRHIFYSLLGNESNALAAALNVNGIDIKKDLQCILERELKQPGKKRLDDLRLSKETVLPTVKQLLDKAQQLASESGAKKVSENHIARSLVELYPEEVTRLLPPSKVLDMASVRRYIADSDADGEEDDRVITRYSIKEIEKRVKDKLFGQNQAIERILPYITQLQARWPREGRPAGVFLFMGPTGTGKTQMAKELAKYVFGDEEMLIFLEMGQFQSKESMNSFVGAPPGYVGYGEGLLTNGLRDKPESVVLFDEIEKANTQVFDAILRFADEGIISDPAGPVRDGRKCIIVMTTNAGQTWLRDYLKENSKAAESPDELAGQLFDAGMKELRERGFRPEFLGRVDETITFLPFTVETCRHIIDRILDRELAKFKQLMQVEVVVPNEVREFLAKTAFERSGNEGARGAPRAVEKFIVTPALNTLAGGEGHDNPTKLVAGTLGLAEQTRVVFSSAGGK